MKTQAELIEELTRLCADNPKMPVRLCVDNSDLLDAEDFRWTAHEIRKVTVCDWYVEDEHIYLDGDIPEEARSEEIEKVICIFTTPRLFRSSRPYVS